MGNTVVVKKCELIGEMGALVTTPTGFDPATEKLPLIVSLHGAGERGEIDENLAKRVAVHGIGKYFGADCDYHGLRCVTVSPECPEENIWDQLVIPLKKFIDEIAADYNCDTDKISITGLSMGGYGTWNMITAYPDYFSCAAPICGGGVSWRTHMLKKGFKIRAFHGLDDDSVPFNNSFEMVTRARAFGADASLTAFDNVGHGSWVNAYEQTDLIEWLVAQSRA